MKTNSNGVRVIWKGLPKAKTGYLKLSITRNGKTILHSLKIKVKKNDFNPSTQRLRASVDDFEKINTWIDDKVSNYRFLPYQKGKITTICEFFRVVIKDTHVNGTKEKYENLLHLFEMFLMDKYKKEDILFEELDSDMVNELYSWLRNRKNKNKKKNKINTVNFAIKGYKALIRKASVKYDFYTYVKDPFSALALHYEETSNDFLEKSDLLTLINFEPVERKVKSKIKIKYNDVKDAFIFATLAQGLRISDIMSLRFNNFLIYKTGDYIDNNTKIIIKKNQLKVKKNVFVSINREIGRFLEKQIIRVGTDYNIFRYTDLLDEWNLFLDKVESRNILKGEYEKAYKYYYDDYVYNQQKKKKVSKKELLKQSYGVPIPELKDLYDKYQDNLDALNDVIYYYVVLFIEYLSKSEEYKNKFVFPFLDDELFNDINDNNDFSLLNPLQYDQFHRRSYLNVLLKDIAKQVGINKNLHFHLARHTYTTLVLKFDEVGMNMNDLQQSLGHQSLLSTQKYIKKFYNEKIKAINDNLTSKVFEVEPFNKTFTDF